MGKITAASPVLYHTRIKTRPNTVSPSHFKGGGEKKKKKKEELAMKTDQRGKPRKVRGLTKLLLSWGQADNTCQRRQHLRHCTIRPATSSPAHPSSERSTLECRPGMPLLAQRDRLRDNPSHTPHAQNHSGRHQWASSLQHCAYVTSEGRSSTLSGKI